MDVNIAEGVDIDAQQVMTGRCCIIGQSGSGKSYLVGVIAEELCRLRLPFLVVDTEGEYSSLKSAFSVIWVGGGDADLDIDSVDLARLFDQSMRSGIPVVLDLSDIVDKDAYVSKALSALYALEESARKPYLVIVEEADKFAPQVLHRGTNMIEEISVRGRKRGIGLLVATQRPASINKNVLSQCSYGFIGRLTLENDISAINVLFESKKKLDEIVRLATGEFIPFGIPRTDSFMVKRRQVLHRGNTPGLEAAGRERGSLNEVLAELRVPAKRAQRKEGSSTHARRVKIFAVKAVHSIDDAGRLASRLARGMLGLNGMKVENVRQAYLPMLHAQVLVPIKKGSVFKEFYALCDSRGRLVSLGRRVRFVEPAAKADFDIGEKDTQFIAAVRSLGSASLDRLERETGAAEGQLGRALGRLVDIGVLEYRHGKYRVHDMVGNAYERRREFDELLVDEEQLAEPIDQKRAVRVLRIAFPGCKITPLATVYLPVYEIALRKGNTVKLLVYDAVGLSDQSTWMLARQAR